MKTQCSHKSIIPIFTQLKQSVLPETSAASMQLQSTLCTHGCTRKGINGAHLNLKKKRIAGYLVEYFVIHTKINEIFLEE